MHISSLELMKLFKRMMLDICDRRRVEFIYRSVYSKRKIHLSINSKPSHLADIDRGHKLNITLISENFV